MRSTTKSGKSKKTGKKSRKLLKLPKVHISSYKIILLCFCVIAICMGLLILTTVPYQNSGSTEKKGNQKTEKNQPIAERFEKYKTVETPESVRKLDEKEKEKEKERTAKEKIVVQNKNDESVTIKIEPENKIKKSEKTENRVASESVKSAKSETKSEVKNNINIEETEKKSSKTQKKSYDFPAAKNNAQLVFIFDDGGQNLNQLDKFLDLPFKVDIAVLPQLQHSVAAAQKIRKSGNELMLHQPMQAINEKANPGPGAIKPDMSEEQIVNILMRNINEIGPIAGINNHEGSAVTANAEIMSYVLRTASDAGVFFLDSRTNVETKVPLVAKEMGYNYYERNIFLDNEKTKQNVLNELKKGLGIANKNGVVIMIGHVWSADFLPDVLKEVYPELVQKGYTFSVVSESKAKK